jgi:NitT/TauT family transport system substrate-binding protein
MAAHEMKEAGLLNAGTDPVELAHRAWIDLEGVTDDWIKGLTVERIAGGGLAPAMDDARIVELFGREKDMHSLFCLGCDMASDLDLCGR